MLGVQDRFQLWEIFLHGILGDESKNYHLQKGKLSNPKKEQMK
jgi:hypothetical protein